MANLGWDEVRLPNPLFEGDTLYSQSEVLEKRESKSRPNVGIVRFKTTGFKQDGTVVIEFKRTVMIYRRGHVPETNRRPENRTAESMIGRGLMTATPTPGGISERSMALPVVLSGEAASISRWWRLLGGVLMTLALGTLYAWSVFVTPLENEFGWKRAQTSSRFYFRGRHVCRLAASRRKTSGPLRALLDFADRKHLDYA